MPVSMMAPLKVSRSTIAAQSRGSVKVLVQPQASTPVHCLIAKGLAGLTPNPDRGASESCCGLAIVTVPENKSFSRHCSGPREELEGD